MPDAHTAERLRRRTIEFLARGQPWLIDEDLHPTRLDPVERELELALEQRERNEEETRGAQRSKRLSGR